MRNFKAPPLSAGAQLEADRAINWINKSDFPLYVEIGCGAGFHPLLFVRENPNYRILAFERTVEKFEKAKLRLQSHLAKSVEYQRCLIVHADAAHLWATLFQKKTIAGLIILYPNPYPKKQHANRRLAGMPFFKLALASLQAGGEFLFATNEINYFEELLTALQSMTDFRISFSGPIKSELPPRSHFEKKYRERNQVCFEIRAHKY